jgi:hypothetical protein
MKQLLQELLSVLTEILCHQKVQLIPIRNTPQPVLNCTFKKGIVALDLWFQKYGFQEQLKTIFSWQGSAEEFRESINLMIYKADGYKYFLRR